MESIVNSIISSYLADYLEINPEKTKLSVLSGTVDLYGVKFKKNLFSTLNLPYLELVDGYVGRIHVNLSLPRFYLYPINVQVEKIYIKVKPKNVNKISKEEILKTFDIYKKKKLQQFEELMNIKFSLLLTEDKKDDKKDEKKDKKKNKKEKKEKLTMLENIINNLHIKIKDFVFIFDDCVSNPEYPVTLGVTLNTIFIDSTSKDFKYNKLSEEEKMSPLKYKKLSIENLNIFLDNIKDEDIIKDNDDFSTKLKIRDETRKNLNEKEKKYLGDSIDFYLYCESEILYYCKETNFHSYLIRDLNPEIRLIINEKFYDEKNKNPQISGTVDIKIISFEVSNKQIKALTNTLNYISLKDFYQKEIIDKNFNEIEKIDNDLIRNYLEEYSQYYKTKYIEIYKNEKESKKYLANMEKLEKNLRLDSITALREMGNDVINSMIELGKIEKELKTAKGGFLGYFKSKNNAEIDKLKLEREKKIKEQKELQEKNSTMNKFNDLVSSMLQIGEGDNAKEDKIEFVFIFLMEKLNLVIKEEKEDKNMKKIFEINFFNFETQIILRTISQFIKVSLKDMKFSQFLSKNKNYETILYSENLIQKEKEKEKEEASLILIEFEHNLKLEISPFKFKLNFGKQIFIIVDYYYLFYLYNLFIQHITALDFNNLSAFLNDKITSIVKIGYDNLVKNREIKEEKEGNNTKLFNLHVDISLTAPILLFPLYFRDINNSQILYISLGILKIKSQLADTVDEKAIYDKYIVEFSNFIMKTITNTTNISKSEEILSDKIGENIIDKSSFNIELQNYIYKIPQKIHKNKDFSPLLININLNSIKFCLCEEQIVFMINYLENFQRTRNEFEREKLLDITKKSQKEKKEKIPLIKDEKVSSSKEEKKYKENKVPLFKDEKVPLFKEDKIPLFKEDKVPLFKNEKTPLFQEDSVKKAKLEKNEIIKKESIKKEEKKSETIPDKVIKDVKVEEKKKEEITNILKLTIQFGSVELLLKRNLEQIQKIKFLSFLFKESFLNLLMTSDNSMNMDISFGHFFLNDEDMKLSEYTKKTSPAINPEFKYIIGTTSFDFKTPKGNKIKLSEIYNNNDNEKNDGDTKTKESIRVTMNLDAVSKKIDVYITMCKLTISPNFSSIGRAFEFLFKYLEIYNESLNKLKFEKLREEMDDKSNSNSMHFEGISAAPMPSIAINDKKEGIVLKSREKSLISVFILIEGINILLPIEPESSNTHIIFMSLEMPINYVLDTDAEFFYQDSKLIKVNYILKKSQISIYIKEGNFSIYEYKDDFILLNNKNKLIDDFSFSLLLNNNLDNKEKANKNDLKIYLNKTTEISININHIILFLELFEKMNEFLKKLNKNEDIKITLNKKQEFIDDDDFQMAVKNSIVAARESQEEIKKLQRKESKKLNENKYIDIYIYEISFADFYIRLYDLIDGTYQSLFEFSMKDSKFEFMQNSNPRDSSNLIKYIKCTLSKDIQNYQKFDTYDNKNFFMYLKMLTNIEIKSLNTYLNQWEYFIEPFKLEFYFCQLLRRMRPNIELFINNMINVNVSLNFAKIVQFVLKKFKINKEEIKKQKEETPCETPTMMDNTDTPRYIGYETPALIIINSSGVDMDIWFDNIKYDQSNKDFIIRIKNDEKLEFSMNSLHKYNVTKKNNSLNSTLSFKFFLEQKFMYDNNIDEKMLTGNYFNINYHHIEIHDISNQVKVSVESCSDNLLIRHVIFSSLISIKNETKFRDIQISNLSNGITLDCKKKKNIPISWLLDKKNIALYLNHNGDKSGNKLLARNYNELNQMNRVITFNDGNVIMIDFIKYKFNLNEYYIDKNPNIKKVELYRTDIIITSPLYFINNTPYDFIINSNEKISSTKSLSSYTKNSNLLLEYRQKINNQDKKYKISKDEIIMKILKDIKFQIFYQNKYILADTYILEKEEDFPEEKDEEGKVINNYNIYKKSISILLKNVNTKDYLICRLILDNPYKALSFDNKLYENIKIELNSFRYEIIFDYYFINKTFNNIFLNNKSIDLVRASKENILLSAKQFIPISKILLNDKVKFRKSEKNWTDNYEYSALGKEFVLNIKNENKTYNALSVVAKVSDTFRKSITIIIDEKFIVINKLPFEICIKENKMNTVLKYKSNESSVLLFDKESLNKKDCFRCGIDGFYSHIFDVSKLGSYDLLIPYDKQTFDKFNINIENKLVEYDFKKYYPIRCLINTITRNTIYIIFSLNHQYINQLRNCTPQTIQVFVNDHKTSKFIVRPEKTIPLVYINKDNKYKPFENVRIVFSDNDKTKVNINEISSKFCGANKNFYIRIRPEKNNSVKSIILYNKYDKRLGREYSLAKRIKKFTTAQGAKIMINLEGLGFSIIDEKPREIFYLSIYKIFLKYNYISYNNILNEMTLYNSITFSIKNLELDYCLENSYDLIFNPTNQILPPKKVEKEKTEKNFIDKVFEVGDEETPFIQFVISQKTMQEKVDNKVKVLYTIIPEIGFIMQEFDVRINTILINCIINLVNQYMKIFLPEGENNNEMDSNKINTEQNLLLIDDNININKVIDKLLNTSENINNLIINYLTLSAIKANTTFKINKNAINIKFVPELFITILNTICSALTSFSDVTIKLSEFTFVNVFSDMDSIYNKLYTFYKNELLAQIYKIILNMDLIGSPINLVEGLGTGLFAFFNEPRKGLLKGPEEFGIGIAKGTKTLVSNIVGGGFNSVSKITGSLLTATKNISSLGTEEEVIIKEEEKPRGLLDGTLSGFKKGFGELASGITGIVTKPIEQTKKGGVGGFFKGLGSGLLGAVLSPVNSVLTGVNEVSSGISNSEIISNKKSLRRFRLPRTLYKYVPIKPYNEEEERKRRIEREKAKENGGLVVSLSNELLYLENSTSLINYCYLKDGNLLLSTNVMIKLMNKECTKFFKKIYVCNLEGVRDRGKEVQLVMKNTKHEFFIFRYEKEAEEFVKTINKYI